MFGQQGSEAKNGVLHRTMFYTHKTDAVEKKWINRWISSGAVLGGAPLAPLARRLQQQAGNLVILSRQLLLADLALMSDW